MPELIRSALADSVDWAMYWQPPDAEDTLFGDPRLVQALERVAEHVASTGIIQSWMGASTQANQWMITWTGESAEGQWEPGLEPAQSQLKAWNLDLAEKERASKADLREKMDQLASGHWWSNPPGGLYRSFGTFELEEPIGLACVEDGMGWSSALVRRLQIECRKPVFHITEPRHWVDLCRRYPLEVSATMRRNWFETTGRDGLWVQPHWQAVAEDYDGVHLGLGAYLAGAGRSSRWMPGAPASSPDGTPMRPTGSPMPCNRWTRCVRGESVMRVGAMFGCEDSLCGAHGPGIQDTPAGRSALAQLQAVRVQAAPQIF